MKQAPGEYFRQISGLLQNIHTTIDQFLCHLLVKNIL